MSETFPIQLAVNYGHLDVPLEFSDVPNISDSKKAFKIFIDEMLQAMLVIQELQILIKQTDEQTNTKKIDQLFLSLVRTTSKYYFIIRTYSIKCGEVSNETIGNSEMTSDELNKMIAFESEAGPFVREFGDLMAMLTNYTEILFFKERKQQSEKVTKKIEQMCEHIVLKIVEMLEYYQQQYLDRAAF